MGRCVLVGAQSARDVVCHSLARRVVDALERVERGEPEEEDERHEDDHVLEPVRPDELAAEEGIVPVRRVEAAQRRLVARWKPRGAFQPLDVGILVHEQSCSAYR